MTNYQEHRDSRSGLKKMVEVLAQTSQLRKRAQFQQALQIISQQVNDIMGLDLNFLDQIPEERFLSSLTQDRNLPTESIKILAELLYERGDIFWEQEQKQQAQSNFARSLPLYEYVVAEGRNYSSDWNSKLSRIRNLLDE